MKIQNKTGYVGNPAQDGIDAAIADAQNRSLKNDWAIETKTDAKAITKLLQQYVDRLEKCHVELEQIRTDAWDDALDIGVSTDTLNEIEVDVSALCAEIKKIKNLKF